MENEYQVVLKVRVKANDISNISIKLTDYFRAVTYMTWDDKIVSVVKVQKKIVEEIDDSAAKDN